MTYRPDRERVYFDQARVHLLGLTSPALPRFSVPVGEANDTGLLTPGIGITRLNGVELVLPSNIALGQPLRRFRFRNKSARRHVRL